jgi:hypothetical protein
LHRAGVPSTKSDRGVLVAPRHISVASRSSLARALTEIEPQKVLIVHFNDAESYRLATDLEIAIANAAVGARYGWSTYRSMMEVPPNNTGVRIEISADAHKHESEAAEALSLWLRSDGLSTEKPTRPQMTGHFTWRPFNNGAPVRVASSSRLGLGEADSRYPLSATCLCPQCAQTPGVGYLSVELLHTCRGYFPPPPHDRSGFSSSSLDESRRAPRPRPPARCVPRRPGMPGDKGALEPVPSVGRRERLPRRSDPLPWPSSSPRTRFSGSS